MTTSEFGILQVVVDNDPNSVADQSLFNQTISCTVFFDMDLSYSPQHNVTLKLFGSNSTSTSGQTEAPELHLSSIVYVLNEVACVLCY